MSGEQTNRHVTEGVTQPEADGFKAGVAAFLHGGFGPHAALIALVCVIIYANTLNAPLVFDDTVYIVNNPILRDWDVFARVQAADVPGIGNNYLIPFRSRIVAFFTFALNYRIGGIAPFGYHIVNLLIHISSALALYWLLTMLLRTPRGRLADDDVTGRTAPLLAGLLFAVHPLQTHAVTYVSQRATALSALFYLLALAIYVRSRLSAEIKHSILLYSLSAMMVLLAVRTKETAFTLPVAMVLVEVCFFGGRSGIRLWRLAPWILIAMVIPVSLLYYQQGGADIARAVNTANLSAISTADYFFTEQRVMVTYLRLLIAPVNQNIDYDYPLYRSALDAAVLGPMLMHAVLLWFAVRLYKGAGREGMGYLRWGAFGIAWFYLTLSVESSLIPLGDVIEEYRMYLPLAGVSMSVAVTGAHLARHRQRMFMIFFAGALIALGTASIARNQVWRDPVRLWQDAAQKSPNKARVYNNLGSAYHAANKTDAALDAFSRAVALDPTYAKASLNLANELMGRERYADALKYYNIALSLNPGEPAILSRLGSYYMQTGDLIQAESYIKKAIEANPFNAEAYGNMGSLYRQKGQCDKTMAVLKEALRLNPAMAEAHYTMGLCHADNDMQQEAIMEFLAALNLNNNLLEAQVNLGLVYLRIGQGLLASEMFKAALKLEPSAGIMTDLADAYQGMGEHEKARQYYLMAIETDSAFAPARFNYIILLAREDRRDEALAQVEGLRRISPERVARLMADPLMRGFLAGKGRP